MLTVAIAKRPELLILDEQWYETAIFLAAAPALAGLCFWWVRRRLT